VLPGEGSFHQYHGGVTTAEIGDREEVLQSHRLQLRAINGGSFEGRHREPVLLGAVPGPAQEFLKISAGRAGFRYQTCVQFGMAEWPLDARRVP